VWFAQLAARAPARVAYAALFVALGVGLEFAQRATGYRVFEVADMMADALGVAIGWVAAPPRGPHLLALAERALAR
jgi:hypothetical protein